MDVATSTAPRLARSLGTWELAAVGINGVVGSGIFGLPSRAFALAGPYSLVAVLFCALLTVLIVLCFAEVASRFNQTGGPYLYAYTAFGPVPGFVVGWLLWVSWVAAFAANCNLLMDYAAFACPPLAGGPGRGAAVILTVAALAVLNIRGVRTAARASNWLICLKLGSLAGFVAIGLFFVHWDRLALPAPPAAGRFFSSALLLMWAFAGFEKAAVPAGEARDPRTGLPAALGIAVAVTTLLYLLIQAVAIGTVPDLAHSARPLADAAAVFLGPAGAAFISLAAVVSVAGNLNVLMLSAARLPFAMAERGELPRVLAAAHARFRTPHAAIALTALAMAALTLSGTFVYAVTVSTIARLLAYLATCVALPVFRSKKRSPPARLRVPAGPAVALAAIVLIGLLIGKSTWNEGRDTMIAAVIGLLLYAMRPRQRAGEETGQ
jgi:amino acid transporter